MARRARGRPQAASKGEGRKPLKKVGGKRMPARSSSARDEKRGALTVRLNKFLADNGVASRRGSDELIEKGKVTVDGKIVTELGLKIDPATQVVDVDGVILRSDPRERRYYVLHKPSGVVCTNEIRETRPRAIDLVTDPNKGRIFTIGRLDEESKGLILLTSDGEFAERVGHPRFGVTKTYRVKVPGRISEDAVQKIREGVHLSEGRTAGARVLVKKRSASASTLEVSIYEGKNREVRRVFARVGFKVVSLTRIRIGPLTIQGLKEGRWRALSREEVEALLAESDRLEAGVGAGGDEHDDATEHGDSFEPDEPYEGAPIIRSSTPRRARQGAARQPGRRGAGGARRSSARSEGSAGRRSRGAARRGGARARGRTRRR